MTALAGRKRGFDKIEALEKAMRVFWDNGYTGTSLSDLTDALGINKPSLYAAFGNKEQLFSAALNHYIQHYGSPILNHLREPAELSLAERLENYFFAVVAANTHKTLPKGCFVVKSYCESGSNTLPDEASAGLEAASVEVEHILEEFFLSEQMKGALTTTLSPKEITAYVQSVMYGVSVMARRGKSCEALHTVVKTAIKSILPPTT